MIAPTVLLVTLFDDERSIYSHCLRAAGYEVLLADGPEHALTLAPTADVVVTRILQPGQSMNGIELLRHVKHDPALSHVPVIVITSLMQAEFAPKPRPPVAMATCFSQSFRTCCSQRFVASSPSRHRLSRHICRHNVCNPSTSERSPHASNPDTQEELAAFRGVTSGIQKSHL